MTAARRRVDAWRLVRWGPLAVAVMVTLLLWQGVDRWWPLLPLGYGPRWPWIGLAVIPVASGGSRRARGSAVVLTGLVVVWGLLGFRVHLPHPPPAGTPTLRLATFNAGTRPLAVAKSLQLARGADLDLIVVVECPDASAELPMPGYRLAIEGEICVWSRRGGTPRITTAPRDVTVIGWSGTIARLDLADPELPPIGIVHLRSVRDELEEFLDLSALARRGDSMRARHSKRVAGSRYASRWLSGHAPRPGIVVGDFNLVVESPRFRQDWAAWRDGFEEIGTGTGNTWHSRWYGLRIDHVLHDEHWRTIDLEISSDLGSDHRALVVTLARRD